jgi:hypothetical protein
VAGEPAPTRAGGLEPLAGDGRLAAARVRLIEQWQPLIDAAAERQAETK